VVSSLTDAFVWNYFEAFRQLTLNESAANIATPFFLLYQNTSPQIQSSYQAIESSGGRRSHRRFFARPIRPGGGSPDAHGN
jgi:hypothetical protein